MKNYQTPRTLAESQFTTGYSRIEDHSKGNYPLAWWLMVGACAVCGLIAAIWG